MESQQPIPSLPHCVSPDSIPPHPGCQRIVLTGYMGAGKTSLGKALAQELAWRFMDLDRLIERRAQSSIADIFALQGEPRFRHLEQENLRWLYQFPRVVIATGGGALCHGDAMEEAKAQGWVLFLDASTDVLWQRANTAPTHRPLLQSSPILERAASEGAMPTSFESRLQQRRHYYEQAHCRVNTQHSTSQELAKSLIPWVQHHINGL